MDVLVRRRVDGRSVESRLVPVDARAAEAAREFRDSIAQAAGAAALIRDALAGNYWARTDEDRPGLVLKRDEELAALSEEASAILGRYLARLAELPDIGGIERDE